MPRIDYDGRIATVYDRGRAVPLDGLAAWRAALAHYLPPESGLPMLDLGAGTGLFAVALAEWFGVDVIAVEAVATAGFAPEALESVPQVTAESLRAWWERVRLRADSTLQPLDDAVFARRLAEAERAAGQEPVARPVVDRLDLLVLRLGQRL